MALTSITLPGRASRAHELYEVLRKAILDGTVQPGERLVEETLAAMASVSRTPVREAIRKLEADGLIEDTGSGVAAVGIATDALAEVCVVREVLEGLACRLAAAARTELDVLTLEGLAARWSAALEEGGDKEQLVRLNHAFHETIWRAAGNRYLVEQLIALRDRIELSRRTTLATPGRPEEAMGEHAQLIDAIVRRDGDAADELARFHFRRAMAIRLASLRSESLEIH